MSYERDGLQEYQATQNFTNMGCRASADAYAVGDKFKVYFCMGDGPTAYTPQFREDSTVVFDSGI